MSQQRRSAALTECRRGLRFVVKPVRQSEKSARQSDTAVSGVEASLHPAALQFDLGLRATQHFHFRGREEVVDHPAQVTAHGLARLGGISRTQRIDDQLMLIDSRVNPFAPGFREHAGTERGPFP